MKKRVADIIIETLIENEITDCFAVVGGGAMHFDNALAIHTEMNKYFCHHEQACAMAAEGYAKACGKMAAVSVTSGPGGINALNGVFGAYVDNIPMIVIAGHPRWDTTVNATGLNLRYRGVQEYDIVPTLFNMTKYAVMVTDPLAIKMEVQKCIDIAMAGRRGPTWISVPLDVQGAQVETDNLYSCKNYEEDFCVISDKEIGDINIMIKESKRPVILAGSGIRSGGEIGRFREWVKCMSVPVLAGSLLPDVLYEGASFFYGTCGSSGERRGNFIIQNSDLIIVIGNSLATKQTGFNVEKFAPEAKIVMIDAGVDEGRKPGVRVDLFIHADVKDFFDVAFDRITPWRINSSWVDYCNSLEKELGDIDVPVKPLDDERIPNKYMWDLIRDKLDDEAIIALGNSSGISGALQKSVKRPNQRVIVNYNCGSMGDDIPEAIGIAVAEKKEVLCVTGDGSIMMNLQELQTVVHYGLPVKIIIMSNDGYGAIRQTNKRFFDGTYIGCDKDSGVSFPDFKKVIEAFGISFKRCECVRDLNEKLDWVIHGKEARVLEVYQTIDDPVSPRLESKMDENGVFVTPGLEELSPSYKDCERLMIRG